MNDVMCPCGQPLHYASLAARDKIESLVDQLGPNVQVTTPAGSWMIPRHYIALHGVKALELPALAVKYGWEAGR